MAHKISIDSVDAVAVSIDGLASWPEIAVAAVEAAGSVLMRFGGRPCRVGRARAREKPKPGRPRHGGIRGTPENDRSAGFMVEGTRCLKSLLKNFANCDDGGCRHIAVGSRRLLRSPFWSTCGHSRIGTCGEAILAVMGSCPCCER